MSEKENEKIPVTCDKCGYNWKTSSKMAKTTCPSCRGIIKIRDEYNGEPIAQQEEL